MIDGHIHVVGPHLPGLRPFPAVLNASPAVVAARLRRQMRDAGVDMVLAMGRYSSSPDDPLGVRDTLAIADLVPGLRVLGVADPQKSDDAHLARCEEQIHTLRIVGLKVYLGYLHVEPSSPAYLPYYSLAARHHLPVVFHTGDTYSQAAKVRYAHPLLVDDVAVDHPNVNFVLAHFGNPWLMDAAEVIYKNDNVWADLSGFLVGDATYFSTHAQRPEPDITAARITDALRYASKPTHFYFGSDWPLAPISAYADLIRATARRLDTDLEGLFEANARKLFRL